MASALEVERGNVALLDLERGFPRHHQGEGKQPFSTAADPAAVLRAGFVRKVYGILSTQLILTAIVAITCIFSQPIRGFLLQIHSGGWLNTPLLLLTMACLGGLSANKDHYPANYLLLAGFTLLISLDVGLVCSILHGAGLGLLVVQAAAITTAMFLSLTVYAFCSGHDFSCIKGFLTCSLAGLIIGGFLSSLLGIPVVDSVISWCGAAVFSGYVLYDTNELATKRGYDDYIVATVELYLDLVNLFFYILRILMDKKQTCDGGKKHKK